MYVPRSLQLGITPAKLAVQPTHLEASYCASPCRAARWCEQCPLGTKHSLCWAAPTAEIQAGQRVCRPPILGLPAAYPFLQGYFLLRESMLDSVLVARDRFLAPGGALYPSHARLFLAPIRSGSCHQRMAEFQVWTPGRFFELSGPGRAWTTL